VIVGLPAVFVLGVEGVGRAIIHLKYGVAGKTYGLWQYDRELGAIHAPNAYNTNAQTNNFGFRNSEDVIEPKPANALRIIAYGGSTTYCYNLPNDMTWPAQLARILRAQRNPSDQVLNAGAIMWSMGHEFARAKRDLPKFKPDIVIIYSGVNEEANADALRAAGVDIGRALQEGRTGLFTRDLDQARWLKRNSVIVRYLEYVSLPWLRGAGGHEVPVVHEASPRGFDLEVSRNFNATLRDFIALTRAHGARPIYVVLGGLPENGSNQRLLQYSRQGAEVARELDVTVIDAQEIVESHKGDRRALFADSGVHWSQTGAGLLAAFIFERALKAR
jgi:lysophospholipase L1-like esterase